jgi:hypothetical protein
VIRNIVKCAANALQLLGHKLGPEVLSEAAA